MSTTEIILEHLISGIQAAIWLALALLTAFGYDWFSWDLIKDIPTELTLSLVALIYPIGIFVDELADKLGQVFTKKIRDSVIQRNIKAGSLDENEKEKIRIAYILTHTKDDFLKEYFSYIRTRIRIARASSLNLLLVTIALLVFLTYRTSLPNIHILTIASFSFTLTLLAVFAWYQITKTFTQKQIDNLPKPGILLVPLETPPNSGVLD